MFLFSGNCIFHLAGAAVLSDAVITLTHKHTEAAIRAVGNWKQMSLISKRKKCKLQDKTLYSVLLATGNSGFT